MLSEFCKRIPFVPPPIRVGRAQALIICARCFGVTRLISGLESNLAVKFF